MIDATILGYTISNAGPVERQHVEHCAGLSVLYGLNGAGKSSILRAVELGLRGIRGGATIHVRVDDPFEWAEQFHLRLELLWAGTEAIDDAPAELGGRRPPWDPSEWRIPTEMRDQYASAGVYFRKEAVLGDAVQGLIDWELSYETSNDSARADLATQIADQGAFTLKPIGTSDTPRWRIDIAVRLGAGQPLVDQFINHQIADHENVNLETTESPVETLEDLFESLRLDPLPPGYELDLGGMDDDRDAGISLPGWATYPIVYFGVLAPSEAWPPAVLSDEVSFSHDILNYLTRGDLNAALLEMSDENEIMLRPAVQERIAELNSTVNDAMARLIEGPPILSLRVEHPNRLYKGAAPFAWRATDRESLTELPLDMLSDFQRRWAGFAIGLSLASLGPSGAVLVVDEPERTAHPQSIEQLGRGLNTVAERLGADIIASTHAPQLLDDSGGRLLHVRRNDRGRSAVDAFDPAVLADSKRARDELGLVPSDLLQATRLFVMVEGVHDQVVFEELIGDELARIGARLILMRGTKNMPSLLDTQFLMAFTDAQFVVVVDNAAAGRIDKASSALTDAGDAKAHKALARLIDGTPEEQAVAELLGQARRSGEIERISVFGLKERDIIRYLPVQFFDADAKSWSDVDQRRDRSMELKAWLRSNGVSVGQQSLRKAATSMDSIPADFTKLLKTCTDAAVRRNARKQ